MVYKICLLSASVFARMTSEDLFLEEVCSPSFLENAEEEIANHKLQASKALKRWADQFDQFVAYCEDALMLEKNYIRHPSEYSHCEALLKKLKKECDADDKKIYKYDESVQTFEIELKILREQNDKLQDEILQFSEDSEKLSIQEEHLLKQRKEAIESMELMWSSYVRAKGIYKILLCCHIRLHDHEKSEDIVDTESGETLTFSFLADEAPNLKIKLNRKNNIWKMLNAEPLITAAVDAQAFLHKTNDIRAFLCRLRPEALKLSRK